ncbi:MAG: ferredoxin [Candidatus Micrarchaeota archaeon]
MSLKIEHDRPNCIGCGACVAVCPKYWLMHDDGKSSIVGATTRSDEWEELEVPDADSDCNMQAAKSCPVNVIHVTKNNEKLV